MNKLRAEKLINITFDLKDLLSMIRVIYNEEQTAFNNSSDNIKKSRVGDRYQFNLSQMYDAIDNIESAIESINEAVNK